MPRTLRAIAILFAVAGLSTGCEPPDGGGGGLGEVSFQAGLVFVRKPDRDIYISDQSDYSTVARLTTNGNNRHPSLSRDGGKVVYVHVGNGFTELQTIGTVAGAQETPVLRSQSATEDFRHPVFNLEGTAIAFTRTVGGQTQVTLVSTAGAVLGQVAANASVSYASPSFFPDGSVLVASGGNVSTGYLQLEKRSAAGAFLESIASGLGAATAIVNRAILSPDGARVVFDGKLSGSGSGTRTFVLAIGSGVVTQTTEYPGEAFANDTFPAWAGNAEVTFSSSVGGNDNVYILPASSVETSGGLTIGSAAEPWYGEKTGL